jgi:uncharacterized protein (DUF1501 family)
MSENNSNKLLTQKDILVCLFQRGGADGLNSLVPYADSDYYTHRSSLAVAVPGEQDGAIDLDGFFGLHPALSPLKPIYDLGELALIHAAGVPHDSRSHFVAQDLIEAGVTEKPLPDTGWLGRYLAQTPAVETSAFRAISISGNVPLSLYGADEPLAINNLGEFGFEQDIIDAGYTEILGNLFRSQVPFAPSAQAALSAVEALQAANLSALTPENGAVYPETELGSKLQQAGQLIKSNLSVEVIFIDSGDWDHHENLQPNLQTALDDLAKGLSAFHTDMGSRMQGISLFVMSEFGRRVAANASNGVDHGTAGLAYAMGGGVNGGQVIADWPGLTTQDLYMGEDLSITTDLRTLLIELLSKRLGATNPAQLFPDFSGPASANLFLT